MASVANAPAAEVAGEVRVRGGEYAGGRSSHVAGEVRREWGGTYSLFWIEASMSKPMFTVVLRRAAWRATGTKAEAAGRRHANAAATFIFL